MFNIWSDFDRTFAALDELRRRFEAPRFRSYYGATNWPRISVDDLGSTLAVTAEIPGVPQDDINVELNNDTLTISGERKVTAPEGYSVHRQERGDLSFSRSFNLPSKVDPEKVSASVKHGLLSITLEKAPEAKPRQISIKSA
jgi:HSP20 family protein